MFYVKPITTCVICKLDMSKQLVLEHKSTGAFICKKCEMKLDLHSPEDFRRRTVGKNA